MCALPVEAKMVMGIAAGEDYRLVSTFCFNFPPPLPGEPVANGHIHSQTIVSTPGHKFLVLNYTELKQGASCEDLVKKAKVIEPLTERSKEVIAYDLTLNVEPSMNHQNIAAVIARCGQTVEAEYIVEFTNPGGTLERHFACYDQGLLQSYLWYTLFVFLAAPAFYFAFRTLQRRQAHNDISALFFTASGFFGARVCLFTIHLMVYARNGMGLGMLLFVTQFLDFISTTMVAVVMISLTHGVYVTRPLVPLGSVERQVLLQVIGGFTVTYLLSTLVCGFQVDGELVPFGVERGLASGPYVLARVCTGVFTFNRGLKLANEGDSANHEKKQLILTFSVLSAAWFVLMPLVLLFSGDSSWHHDALTLELLNFSMFGILLYYFWPSRFGSVFSCVKPTERMHPYTEFGLD